MNNNLFEYQYLDLDKLSKHYPYGLPFDEGFRMLFKHIQDEFNRFLMENTACD